MLHISKTRCVCCGSCVKECPSKCIGIIESVARIDQAGCSHCALCADVCPQQAVLDIQDALLIAVGTDDGQTIKCDDHVGMSAFFHVWRYENGEVAFLEKRMNKKYVEDESRKHGDSGKARTVVSALEGIDVLVGERFGPNIARIKNDFVCAVVRENRSIEQGLDIVKENINEIIEEKNKSQHRGIVLV